MSPLGSGMVGRVYRLHRIVASLPIGPAVFGGSVGLGRRARSGGAVALDGVAFGLGEERADPAEALGTAGVAGTGLLVGDALAFAGEPAQRVLAGPSLGDTAAVEEPLQPDRVARHRSRSGAWLEGMTPGRGQAGGEPAPPEGEPVAGRLDQVGDPLGRATAPVHADAAQLDLVDVRSEEHTSELQSRGHLVCRLLLEKKKNKENNKNWHHKHTITRYTSI